MQASPDTWPRPDDHRSRPSTPVTPQSPDADPVGPSHAARGRRPGTTALVVLLLVLPGAVWPMTLTRLLHLSLDELLRLEVTQGRVQPPAQAGRSPTRAGTPAAGEAS